MDIPILMYHAVSPRAEDGAGDLRVSADAFASQMERLRSQGYRSVLPRELVAALDGHLKLPSKAVIITFDDALASVHAWAAPVLQAVGFRAAVYVVADCIGGHNAWDDGKGLPRLACMHEGELKDLAARGLEIGSHGRSHRNLPGLDPARLADEVAGSRALLESRFGRVESFCYPFAAYNAAVRRAVVKAGYTNACSHRVRTWAVTSDRFAMRRVFVKGPENLSDFGRKVSPWYLAYRGLVRN